MGDLRNKLLTAAAVPVYMAALAAGIGAGRLAGNALWGIPLAVACGITVFAALWLACGAAAHAAGRRRRDG